MAPKVRRGLCQKCIVSDMVIRAAGEHGAQDWRLTADKLGNLVTFFHCV